METKKDKTTIKSYDEFLRVYFPASKKEIKVLEDPYQYGVEIARESIHELKRNRKEQTSKA